MPSFAASTLVAAPPDQVWETLVDISRWPSWDDALEQVAGDVEPGGRLTIRVRDQSRPFTLRVTTWEPGQQLVLTGGMPLGLFRGTRTYRLEPQERDTCLTVDERYTGPLAGVIGRSIPDLQPSFDAFVAGVRDAAAS